MTGDRRNPEASRGESLFAVLGAGSWGTALAMQLMRAGAGVVLWDWDRAHIEAIAEARCNTRHLPDYPLPDGAWFALCITLCMLGTAVMMAADAQKFYTLRERRGLITDGMFRYVRHPNYLGEMMVYGSFALMVWHWLPVVVLAWVWVGIFAVNMVLKEASMARYPEWAAYRARTGWLLPGL